MRDFVDEFLWLISFYGVWQDDDLVQAVEESALLQRKYEKYLDLTIVNEDFDITFRKVIEALDELAHSHQFVPVNWIYWASGEWRNRDIF